METLPPWYLRGRPGLWQSLHSGFSCAEWLQARSLGKQHMDTPHSPSAAFTFGDLQQQWGIQTPGTALPIT